MNPPSMESGRFLPIKIGEGGSYFRKDDLFFFLCNCFPKRAAVGVSSYSVGGGVTDSWENIHLFHGEPVGSFA